MIKEVGGGGGILQLTWISDFRHLHTAAVIDATGCSFVHTLAAGIVSGFLGCSFDRQSIDFVVQYSVL